MWVRSVPMGTDAPGLRTLVEAELGERLATSPLVAREVPSGSVLEHASGERAYVWLLRGGPTAAYVVRIGGRASDLPTMRRIVESFTLR